MMDEAKLSQESARAARAQNLLDNDLLTEAFDEMERAYIEAWSATKIEDVVGREKLFLAVNVVRKVRGHLNTVVSDGKMAQAQLSELADTAKRRSLFGRS